MKRLDPDRWATNRGRMSGQRDDETLMVNVTSLAPLRNPALATWSTRQLKEALQCAARRARACRRELRARGALPTPKKRPAGKSQPPQTGTARWRALRADRELVGRALEHARGYERLILGNAARALDNSAQLSLSVKQRALAKRCLKRASVEDFA
jgi:hypothetical protein